jgi:hypothetical protein
MPTSRRSPRITLYLYRDSSVRPIGEHDMAEMDTVRDACVAQFVTYPDAEAIRAIDDTGNTYASIVRDHTGELIDDDLGSKPSLPAGVNRYDVTVKKVLVTYATVTVLARDRTQAYGNALRRVTPEQFEEPTQDGSLEVVEVVDLC